VEEVICQKAKSVWSMPVWNTERMREDASGDSEDGEEDDDELPCVIGESEGDCIQPNLSSRFSPRGCKIITTRN